MAEVNKVLITSENLKRFGTNVKMFVNGIKTELATNVSTAQTTADKGVKDAANAASAAAGALAEAKKKIAAGSLAKINGKSLENGGNLSLADIGIDGEIFKVVTARPDLNNAVYNKVYLEPVTGAPTGNVYKEWIKVNDGTADKWEELGEWKADITVDAALSESSVNPVQNMAVQKALTAQASVLNATKNTAEDAYNGVESIAKGYVKYSSVVQLVDISDTDIDALWTSAPDSKS